MVANHHFTRVDVLELKDLIFRKIGHQRAEKYFNHLKRFFCLNLSKVDFDRYCVKAIGRENIPLHNLLIRSIVQNACRSKIPPQKSRKVGCLQSLYSSDAFHFPQSPRKCRSPVARDRKLRDRPIPVLPLSENPSITCEETVTRIQEEQQSETELCSPVEDGEEVEQFAENPNFRRWSSISAPFGVFPKMSGVRSAFGNRGLGETCRNNGELPDTVSLRGRLEKKLASDGIGISLECAEVLNNSLDVFLKRLIEPCIGITRCRDPCILEKSGSNGIFPGRGRFSFVTGQPNYISMLDFRVSMESNPCMFGEGWPMQLEKICHYALKE